MAESSLLSEDEPLCNSQYWQSYLWGFEFLGGLKIRKSSTIGFLDWGCYFFSARVRGNPFKPFYSRTAYGSVRARRRRSGTHPFTSCGEKKPKTGTCSPFPSQISPNIAQCTLCWQFEDQKDTYLDLGVFNVIRKGHFYDVEPVFNQTQRSKNS